MSIRVWHGERQRVGHLGEAQDDFNLQGTVDRPEDLLRLTCLVNGKLPPWPLSVGSREDGFGDGRRLAGTGHFNADIPVACLRAGENTVLLVARWRDGASARTEVVVERASGSCGMPVRIDWKGIANLQDAGQCVDGEWKIEAGRLKPVHTGYDRVFLIGNRTWTDYEATVPVTIHGVDAVTGPHSGGNGVGLLFRFTGHVTGGPRGFPPGQPKWGYQPFGAIAFLRWMDGADRPPTRLFYRGDKDGQTGHGTVAVEVGKTYWMKGACTTLPDEGSGSGVTRYACRIWEDGTREPPGWDWEETQVSATANRTGGLVLLAHHVSASFGEVTVTPVGKGDGP